MFVKICGLRSLDEARLALDAGATALGFLAGLTHRAEDGIDPDAARTIVAALPVAAETVLVTHLTDPAAIATLGSAVGARTIQVHGDVPPDDLRRLRDLTAGTRLIKAVHVRGAERSGPPGREIAVARSYAEIADAILLDSRSVDRLGGTGRVHDWDISARIVGVVAPVPVYLAGGLTPRNVATAIAVVRPAGVDVNSGVEDRDGAKDPARLRAFIAAALAASPAP